MSCDDEVLFHDRARGRAAGERRSRARCEALAPYLGIDTSSLRSEHPPTIIVVGSKGKGTAAAYASAALCGAGRRVGTLTSPGLRSNRERIRVDGQPIDAGAYRDLIAGVAAAIQTSLPRLPASGYLAPTGLFTLAAVRHFIDSGCDAWVLEAGMGGASDEVSLFTADVLAVTSIFGEHLGVLGDTVTEIAEDKLGAASAATRCILSARQRDPQAAMVLRSDARLVVPEGEPVDGVRWPAGLSRENAVLGVHAALLLDDGHRSESATTPTRDVLNTVRLPGRLSVHDFSGRRWIVDAAANPVAVRAAVTWCREHAGEPATVLLCVPDSKDVGGCVAALEAMRVAPVVRLRTDAPHLSFSDLGRHLASLSELDVNVLPSPVLALGTVSFIGEVLTLLGVDTGPLFSPLRV